MSDPENRYEREMFEKLMTVVNAGDQNPASGNDLEIKTKGYQPSASVSIPSYLMKKFLKVKP
jgi:hypothetical protein